MQDADGNLTGAVVIGQADLRKQTKFNAETTFELTSDLFRSATAGLVPAER